MNPLDAVATLAGGSSIEVVDAVSRRYGLHNYLTTTSIDATCRHADEESLFRGGTAAFVFFPQSRAWDCLPGESAEALARVYRASCACSNLPPPPRPPPPPQPAPPPAPAVCLLLVGCVPITSTLTLLGLIIFGCGCLCAFVRWSDSRAPGGRLPYRSNSMQTFTRKGDGSWVADGRPDLIPWLSWLRACCCCCMPGLARCWRTFQEDGMREEIAERHDSVREQARRDMWYQEMSRRYTGGAPPGLLSLPPPAHAMYEELNEGGYSHRTYSPRASQVPRLARLPYSGSAEYDGRFSPRSNRMPGSAHSLGGGGNSPYRANGGCPPSGGVTGGAFYSSPGVTSAYLSSRAPSTRLSSHAPGSGGPLSDRGAALFGSGGDRTVCGDADRPICGDGRLFGSNGAGGYAGCGATPGGYSALAGMRMGQRGVLKVHLKKGVGLKAMDLNGKSDPYVIVTCGKETKKSRVVKATLDPVWNETLELNTASFDDVLRDGLHLKVMDKDTFTKDDPLGEVHVSLEALRASNSHEFSEPLPTQGSILFDVSWEPVAAEQVSTGTLHVHLMRANGLKSMDRNGKSDPYVKLTLAGTTHKSKTIKKTLDPVWDETFKWQGVLRELAAEPLQLHAWDYDFGSRDDKLGHASVDLRGLESDEMREYAVQLSEQGTVHLSIRFVSDSGTGSSVDAPSSVLGGPPLRRCGINASGGSSTSDPPSCLPTLPGRVSGPGSAGRRGVAFSSPPRPPLPGRGPPPSSARGPPPSAAYGVPPSAARAPRWSPPYSGQTPGRGPPGMW